MIFSSGVRIGLMLSFCLLATPQTAWTAMPTNPVSDRDFTRLPSGKDLRDISVNGVRLSLSKGSGRTFSSSVKSEYERIKEESLNDPNHKVQWALMDLDAHRVIARSNGADRRMFGASVAKVYVASTLLHRQEGNLSNSQLQLMADMLVVSSNTAWTNLQSQIGGGSSNRGRERIHEFTQSMGYENTRGFQGTWGNLHGNELTAADLVELLHDTYKGKYAGAETFWKLLHTVRTGASRAKKYIPSDVYVGGKTGTYGGATEIDDKPVRVDVRNHVIVFNVAGKQYGISVLADTGSDESAAVMAGGLFHEYAKP